MTRKNLQDIEKGDKVTLFNSGYDRGVRAISTVVQATKLSVVTVGPEKQYTYWSRSDGKARGRSRDRAWSSRTFILGYDPEDDTELFRGKKVQHVLTNLSNISAIHYSKQQEVLRTLDLDTLEKLLEAAHTIHNTLTQKSSDS